MTKTGTFNKQTHEPERAGSALPRCWACILLFMLMSGRGGWAAPAPTNWYTSSFYLWHEDHHTTAKAEVGRDADPIETARLLKLSNPDVIQIHAKGRPGWTTYPSQIGHTPPKLARDVMAVWSDLARSKGWRFSAYYNIGRDGEIMVRHPEWNRVKADGTPWDTALCYHSGVAEKYLWPMIDEIMARYHPDGFWFDGSCFTVSVCYCPRCLERFQREQHLEVPRTFKAPGWAAFKEMQRQIYREFVRDTARHIKQRDPQCLVAVNWAFSFRMPEAPPEGVDYFTGDHGDQVEALPADACWYDSQDQPFDLMTTVFVRDGRRSEPKPREQLEQEMAVIVANGGRYFAWDNPTPETGLVPERLEWAARVVGPFLRARQPWCLGSHRVPDVSLFHGATAHYAQTAKAPVVFPREDIPVIGADQALRRLHLNHEMISDERLARLDLRAPLLLVENPAALTPANIDACRRYAANGGTLLVTGHGVALAGWGDLLGVKCAEAAQNPEDWTAQLSGQPVRLRHAIQRLQLAGAKTLLAGHAPDGSQHPLVTTHKSGQGRVLCAAFPLVTSAGSNSVPESVGDWVLREALPPARRLLTTDAPSSTELVLREKAGEQILHLVNFAPGQRVVLPVEGKAALQVRITDIPSAPACRVSLRAAQQPASVMLQPQGTPLPGWTWREGRVELPVPSFDIHQMVVVKGQVEERPDTPPAPETKGKTR